MKRDGATARQCGQRPLPPSFLFGTKSLTEEGVPIKASKKVVSLSDFLDRKLGKNKPATASRSVQEKGCCFSSARSINNPLGAKSTEVGKNCALDGAIFSSVQSDRRAESCVGPSSGGELGRESQLDSGKDGQDSRKRKNPFIDSAGEDEGHTASKLLLVLGDDPKPGKKGGEQKSRDGKQQVLFNHYANGAGWWDCDREGVDSEEVGCNEVWEGMGSTTVGGLEWH